MTLLRPARDDLYEFMHNLYIAKICRHGPIFCCRQYVYVHPCLNCRLRKTRHRVKILN